MHGNNSNAEPDDQVELVFFFSLHVGRLYLFISNRKLNTLNECIVEKIMQEQHYIYTAMKQVEARRRKYSMTLIWLF